MTINISITAVQEGFGSERWKAVKGLTDADKKLIEAGDVVFFRSARLSGGRTGTNWRYALHLGRQRYAPRVPTLTDIERLRAHTGQD